MTFEALLQENTSLKSDIQSLQSSLQQTRESLLQETTSLKSSLDAARSEQERLKLVVKSLQHRLFGKSSERRVPDSAQGNLFEQLLSQNEEQEPKKKKIKVAGYEREEKTSSTEEQEAPEGTFPEYLERREQVIEEKPDGVSDEDLELIGEKITERLGTTPEEH